MSDWAQHRFPSVAAIPRGFWTWAHFSPTELVDRVDGSLVAVPAFLDLLEALRTAVGFPLPISSGYRSTGHDAAVGGAGKDTSPHVLGLAVDLNIAGSDLRAYPIVKAAFALGFAGIEVTPSHIHLDMAPSTPAAPRPYFWVTP